MVMGSTTRASRRSTSLDLADADGKTLSYDAAAAAAGQKWPLSMTSPPPPPFGDAVTRTACSAWPV